MLLAVITPGDDVTRADVYLGRGKLTFTRGTWDHVRGTLQKAGLGVGSGPPTVAKAPAGIRRQLLKRAAIR